MKQEVRALRPQEKKMFEWDAKNGLLVIVRKGWIYVFRLRSDGQFHFISSSPKA